MSTRRFKIGVDGGGTKTDCVLVDHRGEIVARHVAAGSNPSVVGSARARAILMDGLAALVGQMPDARKSVDSTLLCMAGSQSFWQEVAGSLTGYGRVAALDDSLPILEIATGGTPGIAIHSGTGSFVAARGPDGAVRYAGGLGWRFGDAGSAYEVGERAVAQALLEAQGWCGPTKVGEIVRAHAGLPADADALPLTRYFYEHPEPNPHIASLAPAILQLAAEGEPTALDLIVATASELVGLAYKVAVKLFPTTPAYLIPVGLSGPILTNPSIYGVLKTRTPLNPVPVEGSPVDGICSLLSRGIA